MGRFYGKVGYVETRETTPGVWTETKVERRYYGDVIKNSRRLSNGESINDNVLLGNTFSIIADPYALLNFHNMRYLEYMGAKWKVESVEVQRPRLNITLGGVYNE